MRKSTLILTLVILFLGVWLAALQAERSKIHTLALRTNSRVIRFIDEQGKDVGSQEFLDGDEMTTRLVLVGE